MGNYNFAKDLKIEESTKKEVIDFLTNFDFKLVKDNDDYRYDLKMSDGENEYTIEIKEDFMCKDTGNVAVEYYCRGKPSGIGRTEADIYFYKIHYDDDILYILTSTNKLKTAIENYKYVRTVTGGDKGSGTKMYLFKLDDYISFSNYRSMV